MKTVVCASSIYMVIEQREYNFVVGTKKTFKNKGIDVDDREQRALDRLIKILLFTNKFLI